MKPLLAVLVGSVLSAGLVWAAPEDKPEDLVNRYHVTTDANGLAASWAGWHPEAEVHVTVKYGYGTPDDRFNYKAAEWESLPDWQEAPEVAKTMVDYREVSHGDRHHEIKETEAGYRVVTRRTVRYVAGGYAGAMTETEEFDITRIAGQLVIRRVDATYD